MIDGTGIAVLSLLTPIFFYRLWRDDLSKVNTKAAEALADPMEYGNLFPDLQAALDAEKYFGDEHTAFPPAAKYAQHKDDLLRNLIEGV